VFYSSLHLKQGTVISYLYRVLQKYFCGFQDEVVPTMTGREAVAYFVKAHHLGNIRSLFFNYAPSRHYSPYDLACVHKNHVSVII